MHTPRHFSDPNSDLNSNSDANLNPNLNPGSGLNPDLYPDPDLHPDLRPEITQAERLLDPDSFSETRDFFDDLRSDTITGVAFKNLQLKKQIVSYLIHSGNATITDLSRELGFSTPKVTDLIYKLIEDGLVKDYGKTESVIGRRPNCYGLEPDSVFFIGVDIKRFHINIGLSDFRNNLVKIVEKIPYELNNTPEALSRLCEIIEAFIQDLPVARARIVGIGANLSGRINYKTGYSYSYFNFHEDPLSKVIEARLGIRTFIENDSRAVAYGEFSSGIVTHEKDVLCINMEHGIGMGALINGQLYYGKSGFAGDFGHTPLFDNEIICHCGKKGCLETEASGFALTREFVKKIEAGAGSIVMTGKKDPRDIQLEEIIEAANKEDTLAIELIAGVGEKMGKGIAMLINIFNPEMVILAGSLSATGDYISLPIKSAINKYSLTLMNNDTQIVGSRLGWKAGVTGACLLVRDRLLALI